MDSNGKTIATDPQRQQTRFRAERRLAELKPHPFNKRLYGDEPVDVDLVASIQARGILEDIVVLEDGTILSGHRRHRAALEAGLVFAEVVVRSDLPEEWQQAGAIVEYNRQRTKTEFQIGQEMKAALWAQGREAHRRQKTTQFPAKSLPSGEPPTVVEILPPPQETPKNTEKGKARDKVGKGFGVSGRTVDKQVAVVDEIDRLTREGRTKEAEQLTQTLNKDGVSAAHRELSPKASPAPSRTPTKPKRKRRLCMDNNPGAVYLTLEIHSTLEMRRELLSRLYRHFAYHDKDKTPHGAVTLLENTYTPDELDGIISQLIERRHTPADGA